MALKNAREVSEDVLETVAGGLQKTNMKEQGFYHIGMAGCGYAYKYSSDKNELVSEILKTVDYTGCTTLEEMERARLERLKAEPGLLTPIPGLNADWY